MACPESSLVQASVDGELDPRAALAFEQHMASCAECQALAADLRQMRESLASLPRAWPVSPGLSRRIASGLDRVDSETIGKVGWLGRLLRFIGERRQWFAGAVSGAALAGAVGLAVTLLQPSDEDENLLNGLLAAHVRSLMPNHLLDLTSDNPHVVGSWFAWQAELAPPVADLDAEGYQLAGGRLDFVDGKRVAVEVYRHGSHVLNLFVWADYEARPSGVAERSGFHFIMWNQGNLTFCAVSDIDLADLKTVVKQIAERTETKQG